MIVRSARPDSHYVTLQNRVVRDVRLSYKARGVLAYLLSLPDNWRTTSEAVARMSTVDGRDAVRSALRELEHAGYLVRLKYQDDAGRWVSETHVYDTPRDELVDNDMTYPLPAPGFPAPDNPALIEHTRKNELGSSSTTTASSRARVCGQCAGTTWRIDRAGELTRCECDGGLRT